MKPLAAVLVLFLCACASIDTPGEAAREAPRAIPLGESYTLHSRTLNEDREINVWIPPGYAESESRHTVLYLIDGGVDQDFPHIAGLSQLGALSWTYEPLIIVGVKTGVRLAELTPPASGARYRQAFPQAGGSSTFRDFLRNEVIPFIEARYRAGDRRAVMGESLAGLFVIDTFLAEPSLFDDYVAVSPSLWWDDRNFARTAPERLRAHAPSDRRIYMSIAQEGGTMREGVAMVRAAIAAAPDKATLNFVHRSDETHATTFHPAALDALRWLYALPQLDYGPAPWWMTEGASPPAPE